MEKFKYYSPRLDRDLISLLYHRAKAERVPMTALVNRLVRDGLSKIEATTVTILPEEQPTFDPSGRKN